MLFLHLQWGATESRQSRAGGSTSRATHFLSRSGPKPLRSAIYWNQERGRWKRGEAGKTRRPGARLFQAALATTSDGEPGSGASRSRIRSVCRGWKRIRTRQGPAKTTALVPEGMAPWETTRDLVAAKAIPTKAPTATVSRFPFARIVPSRNTPTKRARPSCKEESRCAFWLARTAALGKFRSSKESAWARRTRPRIRTRLEIYSRARRRPPRPRIMGHHRSCLPPHL